MFHKSFYNACRENQLCNNNQNKAWRTEKPPARLVSLNFDIDIPAVFDS